MLVAFNSFSVGCRASFQRPEIIFSVNARSASKLLFGRVDESSLAERHDRAVVHGVIEDGACEHESVVRVTVTQTGIPSTDVAQHAASGGAVKLNRVADARESVGIT